VVLELPDNPLGMRADELMFEKSDSTRTAALFANVSGTPLCMIEVAGSFGRDFAAKGDDAMFDFVQSWLSGLYGTDVGKAVKRRQATNWNDEPFVLGAFSAAAPGGQPSRRVLMESVNDRIWFAAGVAGASAVRLSAVWRLPFVIAQVAPRSSASAARGAMTPAG
jgi:hypothetical protein